MDGLHLLNGFHTNATCVGGGTGRRFAEYLFPQNFLWWQVRPGLTVQQAWGSMANDLEPAGTRWRSMSLVGANGVNNLGDHYWGQGSTGPDLTYAEPHRHDRDQRPDLITPHTTKRPGGSPRRFVRVV